MINKSTLLITSKKHNHMGNKAAMRDTTINKVTSNTTINYKIFDKAGFDTKACSVLRIDVPDFLASSVQEVYQTGAPGPLRYHVEEEKIIVNFTVEFKPYAGVGAKLLPKAVEMVKDVLGNKYKPAPATITAYHKDRSLDKDRTVHVNDTIITKATIKINRKNEAKGEQGFVRILFDLQGLIAAKKK